MDTLEFTIWIVIGFVSTGLACVILGIFLDRAWKHEGRSCSKWIEDLNREGREDDASPEQ